MLACFRTHGAPERITLVELATIAKLDNFTVFETIPSPGVSAVLQSFQTHELP